MLRRSRRVLIARPHARHFVSIVPLEPEPKRTKAPNVWPLVPRPLAGPRITIDSQVNEDRIQSVLKVIERARAKVKVGTASNNVAFQHTPLPELLSSKDINAIVQFFQDASTNFTSTAEMKRAAAHAINFFPADEATYLAQRLCEMPDAESYGIDVTALNQLAIVLFRHQEAEKAHTLMKALYMRNKKPSIHVYIAMIEYAIRSRQLPLVLTAYTALRSAQVIPTPRLFNLMWRALVIARRTMYRLQRPRDISLPHLHPEAAPFSIWTLPSEEAINSMVKTLVIDMDTHKIRKTTRTFESHLEFVSSMEELNHIKSQLKKHHLKTSTNLQHALVRTYVRLRRADLAIQYVTDEAWETEREYLERLNAKFSSPRHKTILHELVESSYFYGLFDNASHKWTFFFADIELQRKKTVLAVMKAAATSVSPDRVEQITKRLSGVAARDPALLPTVLRAVAPVSRDSALCTSLQPTS